MTRDARFWAGVGGAVSITLFVCLLALASLCGVTINLATVAFLGACWAAPDFLRAWRNR